MDAYDQIMAAYMGFLPYPTRERYMAILEMLWRSEYFREGSSAIDLMLVHIQRGRPELASEIYKDMNPAYLMNPAAAMAHAKAFNLMGQARDEDIWHHATASICRGISTTGTGSKDAPFIVTHESCAETFAMLHLDKDVVESQIEPGNGRPQRVAVECTDGTVVWFEPIEFRLGGGARKVAARPGPAARPVAAQPREAWRGSAQAQKKTDADLTVGCVVGFVAFGAALWLGNRVVRTLAPRWAWWLVLAGFAFSVAFPLLYVRYSAKRRFKNRKRT